MGYNLNQSPRKRATLAVAGFDRNGLRENQLRHLFENKSGILSHYINVNTEVVYVVFNANQLNLEGLVETVQQVGMDVEFTRSL